VTGDPFERAHHPSIGRPEPLAPGLVAVTAPNAGPMTFTGTRSHLLGTREIAVIDPGPDDPAHLDALVAALPAGGRVTAILVTHAHRDHSAGARALQARVDAPVLGFGARPQSAIMERLAAAGGLGGGEGIDEGFAPDRRLADGETIAGTGWMLEALHTPGHLGDHLCFAWAEGAALFSGDLVMGWSTTLISPPDGELSAFLASLARLASRSERIYYPGHGGPVRDPQAMLAWQRAHRAEREAQILAALATGPATVVDLVASVYPGLAQVLRPAAARNVLAHLVDLVERGRVGHDGPLGPAAHFFLRGSDRG
jgi:glyoxylase-like metal-dependent hydrolase (beta-lactamase superfamily II)